MTYCLPIPIADKFIEDIRTGKVNKEDILSLGEAGSSTATRMAFFTEHFGAEDATEINHLFESKLLLKNRQAAMVDFLKTLTNVTEPVKKEVTDQINSLIKLVNPADEKDILTSLVRKKLGIDLTDEEARTVVDAAKKVSDAKATVDRGGDLPPDELQARLIDYGRAKLDMIDTVEGMKPQGRSYLNLLLNALNAAKTLQTGFLHFSAIGVQLWGLVSTQRAWEGFLQGFKYFANEENYKNFQAYMVSHPDYEIARKAQLGLTDITDRLSTREEAIQSSLLQDANKWLKDHSGGVVPNVFGASSRAFTGTLNYARFNRFVDLLNAARLMNKGEMTLGQRLTSGAIFDTRKLDLSPGSQDTKDLASVVNNFSGRGKVGETLGPNTQAILNVAFYAPRKMVATVQMFNPQYYLSLNPLARQAAIRQLLGSLMATYAVTKLAQQVGYGVNYNPLSSDFMKITWGHEKLDVTGGNAIYLRLLSRLITGKAITASSKEEDLNSYGYKPNTRAGLIGQFVAGKTSPVMGALVDAMMGQTQTGHTFDSSEEYAEEEARQRALPIFAGSMVEYFRDNPEDATAVIPALAAMTGFQLESPLPPDHRLGLDTWGNPVDWTGAKTNPLDQQADKLGIRLNFPGDTINGVKLTQPQYKSYIALSGHFASQQVGLVTSSPGWQSVPNQEKVKLFKSAILSGRTIAATQVNAASANTENDIMKQSFKNKYPEIKTGK